jgi:Leucine-rich repeat (LRR) protein
MMVTGKLSRLCNLELVDFTNSRMNGDILMLMPQCASEKLLELHFGQSSFTATVPKFIGNFTSLRTLDLSNNNLTQ